MGVLNRINRKQKKGNKKIKYMITIFKNFDKTHYLFCKDFVRHSFRFIGRCANFLMRRTEKKFEGHADSSDLWILCVQDAFSSVTLTRTFVSLYN